jgi:hypothetical protein
MHLKTTIKNYLKLISRVAVPIWALGMLTVSASLMASHWITLPHPELGINLKGFSSQSLFGSDDNTTKNAETKSSPLAFHFLYGDCPCSRRILKHVLMRSPVAGISERIVFVGKDPEMEAEAIRCGYEVDVVTPIELQAKYGIESVPLLVVTESTGKILYSGGYTSRKQSLDIHDKEIIEGIARGESMDDFPLYGCAVSKELKSIIDPLGLK